MFRSFLHAAAVQVNAVKESTTLGPVGMFGNDAEASVPKNAANTLTNAEMHVIRPKECVTNLAAAGGTINKAATKSAPTDWMPMATDMATRACSSIL